MTHAHLKPLLMRASRMMGLTSLGRHLTRGGFRIIGFHGVSLSDEHRRFPTLFISPESFEHRLQFLSRHYEIVPLDLAVRDHLAGSTRPNRVVLTFDDGFYNFLGAAVPLLRAYGASATVYTITSDLGAEEPIYGLLLKDVVLASSLTTARNVAAGMPGEWPLASQADRLRLTSALVSALRHRADRSARLAFCAEVGSALRVDVDSRLRQRIWHRLRPSELKALVAEGFDVQLHTHTHHNVVEHRSQVRTEIRENRRILEAVLGRPATDFCYPSGLWERDVWSDLAAEGVRSAVTTRNGPNYPATPVLSLRRFLTGEAMSAAEFEFELSGLRWLAHALRHPGSRHVPSEKRLRYSVQPTLY